MNEQGRKVLEGNKRAKSTHISFMNADITAQDLVEISKLSHLTYIGIHSNKIAIKNIGVLNSLPILDTLIINNSNYNDIIALNELTKLKNINHLNLGGNNIRDISFLHSSMQLIHLDLISNNISDLSPLSNLINLKHLYLANSRISDISALQNLTNLKLLLLGFNQISNIEPLEKLINLDILHLYNNKILDISALQKLTNIRALLLGFNQISNIEPLKKLSKLETLTLNNNKISDISNLQNLIKLEALNLSNNNISSVIYLSTLTNLKNLDLSNNKIIKIDSLINILSGKSILVKDNPQINNKIVLGNNPFPKEIESLIEYNDAEGLKRFYKNFSDFHIIHKEIYEYLLENEAQTRFTLRSEKSGLKKQFWFKGDEKRLFFSFWQGEDWQNKTPNIYFEVTKDGQCTLEFVTHEDAKKYDFLSELAETLGMTSKKTEDEKLLEERKSNHWSKNYRGTGYIASLETFLKRDKRIIEAFIKSNDMQDVLLPIDEKTFLEAKKRIEAIRESLKLEIFEKEEEPTKAIVLKTLAMQNISLFSDIQKIDFHKNLTCFIGLNGSGKTSILRGVALAFAGYEQNDLSANENILLANGLRNMLNIKDIKLGKAIYPSEGGFVELGYQVETFNQQIDETIYQNRVLLTVENDKPRITDDSNSEFRNIGDKHFKCLFLAFPQLQSVRKEETRDELKPNIYDTFSMLANQPDNRFEAFAKWLIKMNNIANDKIAKGDKNPQEKNLLQEVFKIISAVTGETVTLNEIDVTKEDAKGITVKLGENASPIYLHLVSQGYNNVFGWIGYFMKRLVDVTPEGKNFKETPAIVLIDEIDTYLHPKWQANILAIMVETFANVQFIVTTHSPMIVANMENSYLYNVKNNKISRISNGYYGKDFAFTLETLFDKKPRNDKVQGELNELFDLIDNESFDLASQKLEILNEKFPDEPELTRAQTLITLLKD